MDENQNGGVAVVDEQVMAQKKVAPIEGTVAPGPRPGVRLLQLKARLKEIEKQGKDVDAAFSQTLAFVAPRGRITEVDIEAVATAQAESYRNWVVAKLQEKAVLDAIPVGTTSLGGAFDQSDLVTVFYGTVDVRGDHVRTRKESTERLKGG